jgi:hypothetical protein
MHLTHSAGALGHWKPLVEALPSTRHQGLALQDPECSRHVAEHGAAHARGFTQKLIITQPGGRRGRHGDLAEKHAPSYTLIYD